MIYSFPTLKCQAHWSNNKNNNNYYYKIIIIIIIIAHNWKSSGIDQLQNYWLKVFPATHRNITRNFNAK
jgi:hypothetical protein